MSTVSAAPSAVAGVVIAGGRSVRFGGEKAAALLGGRPLLLRATERLQAACVTVAVNARRETQAEALARAHGLKLLYDDAGDAAGPLAGVKVGLRWAREIGAQAVAVSPCDAPLLPDDLFVRLIREACGGASMAETADGVQPLCSVWPVSALPVLTAALANGAHPPTWKMLDSLGARRVRFAPAGAFANVNTQADLAAVAAQLERDPF